MMEILIKRLPSGYVHIRGIGPCNWAQVERWPCTERELLEGTFAEACDEFVVDALSLVKTDSRRLGYEDQDPVV